jgi:hypothetical protein
MQHAIISVILFLHYPDDGIFYRSIGEVWIFCRIQIILSSSHYIYSILINSEVELVQQVAA